MNRDVKLRIEGGFPERIINHALAAGVNFARIRRSGRVLIIATDARGAAILKALCERWFLDLRILHRSGLSAVQSALKGRMTLVPALLLGAALCMLPTKRIWRVEIEFIGARQALGNRAAVAAQLEVEGIRPGMSAAVDLNRLEKRLIAALDGYSFIGLRRQGVLLRVEAAPELPAPELPIDENCADLVAARDGVVEGLRVYAGEACVKIGDAVRRGTALICGRETVGADAQTREEIVAPVRARGEVIARCWFEGCASAEVQTQKTSFTGRERTRGYLRLMKGRILCAPCADFDRQTISTRISPIVGLFLPLKSERETLREITLSPCEAPLTALRAQTRALSRAEARLRLAEAGTNCEIIDEWADERRVGNRFVCRWIIEARMNIAAEAEGAAFDGENQ